MKTNQFTEEQMVAILREAEKGEESIGQVCRRHGISDVTFFRWRRKFGGLEMPEMRRLRELEKENARLKRLLAERDLEIDVVRELLSKNS
jgi:putative transposase